MPAAQGRVIQTSSWIIGGMPIMLAFREGKEGENFGDMSPFLQHTIIKQYNTRAY